MGKAKVGAMNGKGREIGHLMVRRGVNILYVQETRWKRGGAKSLQKECKLFYSGVEGRRWCCCIIERGVLPD